MAVNPHCVLRSSVTASGKNLRGWTMERFDRRVDLNRGAGIPASLMRYSEPEASDGLSSHPAAIAYMTLIVEQPSSLAERFRQLCYWRQVINSDCS